MISSTWNNLQIAKHKSGRHSFRSFPIVFGNSNSLCFNVCLQSAAGVFSDCWCDAYIPVNDFFLVSNKGSRQDVLFGTSDGKMGLIHFGT